MRVAQPEARLCWAAAIKSYTFSTPGIKNTLMKRVIEIAKDNRCVEPDGTLKNEDDTFRMLEREFGLTSDANQRRIEKRRNRVHPSQSFAEIPRDELPPDYFVDKLKHSHVVFAYFLGSGPTGDDVFHTVTVYGYDKFSYCYMDPLRSKDPLNGKPTTKDHYHRCLRFSRADVILDYIAFWL
jgi:hypothetical protein